MRLLLTVTIISAIAGSLYSCHSSKQRGPVFVHVVRDPSSKFRGRLRAATYRFDEAKPVANGRPVMITTNEGKDSYSEMLRNINSAKPEILILNSHDEIKVTGIDAGRFGDPMPICGGYPAYIPAWVSGDELDAARNYLQFIAGNCEKDN